MKIIDYYSDLLNYMSIELYQDDLIDATINNYLYILKDKLEGPLAISTVEGKRCIWFTYQVSITEQDRYIIFIPYKEYIISLAITAGNDIMSFFLYKDDLLHMHIQCNELKNLINWIEIDELIDKVNQALEYIQINLKVMNNYSLYMGYEYRCKNKHESFIYRDINCFIEYFLSDFINAFVSTVTYDVYIYNGLLEKYLYVNCIEDRYTLDSHSMHCYENSIFVFPLKGKSIICLYCWQYRQIIISFIKDGHIIYDIQKLPLKMNVLFNLIDENDILIFLKKVNYFSDNTWKKYKKPLDESV